ncbi:hypothetical protein FBQ97_05035 [Acidobacteria bacterium ACD]|nr:MAG: hypothetical protein EDX89_03705 [Acidobacteriota bacterium]MCE7957964.1 hypothetical protein [Acidobacteria bacterium ACB2]MDL1949164.1 hypothetical protein [Acidobacteria bacterium ACD]
MRLLTPIAVPVLASLLAAAAPAAPSEGAPPLPPARKVPGITAPDTHPGGCVDCHVRYPERKADERLSVLMAGWRTKVGPELLAKSQAASPPGMKLKGKHPPLSAAKDVPASCLRCHSPGSKSAPPFAALVHAIHLTGGEANHFLTVFQGECTLCHKLDAATGTWRMPSGPEK